MSSSLPCMRWLSTMAASRLLADADGVDVAGEVEVEVLHRDELRVAAAGRAALDAEDRAEGGLAQGEHGVDADGVHRLGEADGRDRLALAERRRGDGRDVDDLAVGLVLEAVEQGHVVDLGLVATVELQLVLEDAGLLGDRLDGLHGRRPGRSRCRSAPGTCERISQNSTRPPLVSTIPRVSLCCGPDCRAGAKSGALCAILLVRHKSGQFRTWACPGGRTDLGRGVSGRSLPGPRATSTQAAQEPLKRLRAADCAAS